MFIVTHPINYPLKSDYYGYETNLSGNKVKVCHEDSEIVDKEQLGLENRWRKEHHVLLQL